MERAAREAAELVVCGLGRARDSDSDVQARAPVSRTGWPATIDCAARIALRSMSVVPNKLALLFFGVAPATVVSAQYVAESGPLYACARYPDWKSAEPPETTALRPSSGARGRAGPRSRVKDPPRASGGGREEPDR